MVEVVGTLCEDLCTILCKFFITETITWLFFSQTLGLLYWNSWFLFLRSWFYISFRRKIEGPRLMGYEAVSTGPGCYPGRFEFFSSPSWGHPISRSECLMPSFRWCNTDALHLQRPLLTAYFLFLRSYHSYRLALLNGSEYSKKIQ